MNDISRLVSIAAFSLIIGNAVSVSSTPFQKDRRSAVSQVAGSQEADQEEDKPKDIRCGNLLVRGCNQLTQPEVCHLLDGISNGPLDSEAKVQIESALIPEYNSRGFLDAAVVWETPENATGAGAGTSALLIEEGAVYTVRRMEIVGNKTTRDNIIRRRIPLDEGSPFDEELLQLSIRRLNRLGTFEEINREDVTVTPNKKGHYVDLTLTLREK